MEHWDSTVGRSFFLPARPMQPHGSVVEEAGARLLILFAESVSWPVQLRSSFWLIKVISDQCRIRLLLRVRRSEPRRREIFAESSDCSGVSSAETPQSQNSAPDNIRTMAFNPESKDLQHIARQTESRQRRLKWTSADRRCALPCCATPQPSQVLKTASTKHDQAIT